jgi:cell division protein FtsB
MLKKRKNEVFWQFSIYFIFSFLTFLFLFWSFLLFKKQKIISENKKELETKINFLKEKNAELKENLERINDEKYLEEKAREKGYKKENEGIVLIK